MIKYKKEVVTLNIIKIMISDFDGTIHQSDNSEIFASNKKMIDQWRDKGLPFVIATGRSPESLRAIFPSYAAYSDYCIFNDGALIVNSYDRVIFNDSFGDDLANRINNILLDFTSNGEYEKICFSGFDETKVLNGATHKIRFWFDTLSDCIALQELLEEQLSDELTFLPYHKVLFNDDTRLPWIKASMHSILEVNRKGVDKKNGVDKLLNSIGLRTNSYVFTIGDDKNDLTMLKAYNGYIISGAKPEITQQFDEYHKIGHLYELIQRKLPR